MPVDNHCKKFGPDLDRQNYCPDLDANHLNSVIVLLIEVLKKFILKKNQQTTKHGNLPSMQKVKKGHLKKKIACIELMEYG